MKLYCRYLVLLTVILLGLISCINKKKEVKQYHYFDLEGFFNKEAERLKKTNNVVLKSVSHNKNREDKKVEIDNWETELELFKNSDINKPAWKSSYKQIKKTKLLIYSATDSSLKTREIKIRFSPTGKISGINIYNRIKTALYSSTEHLSYRPDSCYTVIKYQKVSILGENRYQVSVKFVR